MVRLFTQFQKTQCYNYQIFFIINVRGMLCYCGLVIIVRPISITLMLVIGLLLFYV